MTSLAELKTRALAAIDTHRDQLVTLSASLHAHPEIAFQEFQSAKLLCATLEQNVFAITRGVGTLETAFRAECAGNRAGATIAFLAEYDALPDIGHACGHNLIAGAAIGAAIGARAVMEHLPGRVIVIGTPGEEGGGGKIILVNNRVFDDVDAALIVHPSGRTIIGRGSLASTRLNLEFSGRAAHAAAAPDDGINALEAVILTFNNVNALRLHLRADARVHGIITNGGSAANIIPDFASAQFSVRAATQKYADEILRRVIACAQAAGIATCAQLKYATKPGYAEMISNPTLARLFADNWRAINVPIDELRANERMGSTDTGNVSQVVPALHPYIAIGPEGIPGHTIEFRDAAISDAGHAGMLNAAKGMALTAIDLLSNPGLVQQAKQEFANKKPGRS